ncbi:hypothetical protein JRQ81_011796 [Phrynocephalus forsythii]|uniref:Uncharacterized protein n=1 Tax=Phrynocephalus forsythii TaxID=171643 RepID=A0A9Q1AQU2_9SAUR|nr:hypothetical protein JRQ81_011796 [Phrynocephalus forsythii]
MIVADPESCEPADVRGCLRAENGRTLRSKEDRRRKLVRSPSSFIPVEEVLQEGAESAQRHLFIEAFVSTGRVDNITMVMGLHPEYLTSFWKTQYLLLRMDGPLPYHKRHYIAIMAAARHQCSYLVGFHMGEFLQMGETQSGCAACSTPHRN